MDIAKAFQIVLDLAKQNQLTYDDLVDNPELDKMAADQIEAINMVENVAILMHMEMIES